MKFLFVKFRQMLTEYIQMEQILQYLILSYTRAVNLTDLLQGGLNMTGTICV